MTFGIKCENNKKYMVDMYQVKFENIYYVGIYENYGHNDNIDGIEWHTINLLTYSTMKQAQRRYNDLKRKYGI